MGEGNRRQRVFFIDSENGIERLIEGCENLNPDDLVLVFIRASASNKVKEALSLSPARVEWVACVDPKVKNSMDVQIIVELTLRLALSSLDEGYIVRLDKGYNPALHYLQREPVAHGCELILVPNISQALVHSVARALRDIERVSSCAAMTQTLSLVAGEQAAKKLMRKMVEVVGNELCRGRDCCGDAFEANGKGVRSANDIKFAQGSGRPEDELLREIQKDGDGGSLADLRGLGAVLSKKLQEAGIADPDKLREIGPVDAWRRIRESDTSFSPRWVYMFEVAITGNSLGDIAPERKRQLREAVERVA